MATLAFSKVKNASEIVDESQFLVGLPILPNKPYGFAMNISPHSNLMQIEIDENDKRYIELIFKQFIRTCESYVKKKLHSNNSNDFEIRYIFSISVGVTQKWIDFMSQLIRSCVSQVESECIYLFPSCVAACVSYGLLKEGKKCVVVIEVNANEVDLSLVHINKYNYNITSQLHASISQLQQTLESLLLSQELSIDEIVLAGNEVLDVSSSALVRSMVNSFNDGLGIPCDDVDVCYSIESKETVARGIAIHGALVECYPDTSSIENTLMLDRLDVDIGVMLWKDNEDQYFQPILNRGRKLPCIETREFQIENRRCRSVSLQVFSVSKNSSNQLMGCFDLLIQRNQVLQSEKGWSIKLQFSMDQEKQLTIDVMESSQLVKSDNIVEGQSMIWLLSIVIAILSIALITLQSLFPKNIIESIQSNKT